MNKSLSEAELIQDIADMVGGTQRLADLARINRRSVLRYANGQNWVPPSVWGLIEEVLAQRAAELPALRQRVVEARAAAQQAAAARPARDMESDDK